MKAALLLLILTYCHWSYSYAQVRSQRLIAKAEYIDTGANGCCPYILRDSVSIKYSAGRHSKLDFQSLDYFDIGGVFWNGSPIWTLFRRIIPNNIDSLDNALAVDFDSLLYFNTDSINIPISRVLETCSHYPDSKPSRATRATARDSTPTYVMDFIYFSGELNRTEITYSANPADKRIQYLVRDTYGNIVGEQYADVAGNILAYAAYEYDSLGQYTARTESYFINGKLEPDNRYLYDYYPDGRVSRRRLQGLDQSGDFTTRLVDTFGYLPGIQGYTSRTIYLIGNSKIMSQQYFHVNTSGLIDTAIINEWGGSRKKITAVEYNSYGNPVLTSSYTIFDTTRYGNYQKNYYYYEMYDQVTGVAQNLTFASISVFPNPMTGNFTICYPNYYRNTPVQLSISDMLGKLVYKEVYIPQRDERQINLGERILPGVYSLEIQSAGKEVLFRGKVVKQ